jgi:type IV secretion system protein VirD4
MCFQSLDQINKCFGDRAATVLDNLATQIYFSVFSYHTADEISKRIGEWTIQSVTTESNSGWSRSSGIKSDGHSTNQGGGISVAEMGRRLLRPEEIMTLDPSVGVLFHKWHPPVLVHMIEYFSDPAFREQPGLGWGTGRSKGLGAAGLVLGLFALAFSCLVTAMLASLPPPGSQPRPRAAAQAGFANDGELWRQPAFQPSGYGPGQPGRRPLPYRRPGRPYSY